MTNAVYTFGPQAHPSIAISLRDALAEIFHCFRFELDTVHTTAGPREAVVLVGNTTPGAWSRMTMFAQGFVAGFGGGITPPTRKEAMRRTQTRADCPAAKRNSDPPPPVVALPPAPATQVLARTAPMRRFNTLTGVAPQSNRPRA